MPAGLVLTSARFDADFRCLIETLTRDGRHILTIPDISGLFARGVVDAVSLPWSLSATSESGIITQDGHDGIRIRHGTGPAISSLSLTASCDPIDIEGHDVILPLGDRRRAELRQFVAGTEEPAWTSVFPRTIRWKELSCGVHPALGEDHLIGFEAFDDGHLTIGTSLWDDTLAVRFILARDPGTITRIEDFSVDRLVAASSRLIRVEDGDGPDQPLYRVRSLGNRLGVVFPKHGRALAGDDIMHEAAILESFPKVCRIVVEDDGTPFLRYGIDDVLEMAPRNANAYWHTGQMSVGPEGKGFDVKFCRVAVDRSFRYRSQAEIETDPDLALAVADALEG